MQVFERENIIGKVAEHFACFRQCPQISFDGVQAFFDLFQRQTIEASPEFLFENTHRIVVLQIEPIVFRIG